jgi:hypothetical protein
LSSSSMMDGFFSIACWRVRPGTSHSERRRPCCYVVSIYTDIVIYIFFSAYPSTTRNLLDNFFQSIMASIKSHMAVVSHNDVFHFLLCILILVS